MARVRRLSETLTFGGRVPAGVGGLVAAVLVASIAGAFFRPVRDLAFFSPALVWRGEVWRLVSYPFFETDPLSLVMGGFMLWVFGRDLSAAWGEWRLIRAFLGLAAGAAAVTSLLALAWPRLQLIAAAGPWPVIDALVLAWALRFPDRQLFYMFVLPLNGRALIWITVGGTALYAVFYGVAPYVPHLLAEGLVALWLRGPRLRLPRLPRRRRRRGPFAVIHADRDPDQSPPRWMN